MSCPQLVSRTCRVAHPRRHASSMPRLTRLPGDVENVLTNNYHLITPKSAHVADIGSRRIRRLCEQGFLVRLARGVYASREIIENADPWEAFALKSRAFVHAAGPHSYASGWSAVALAGLPTISPPPELPRAVVPDGLGSDYDSPFGHVRAVALPIEHRTTIDGCRLVAADRMLVDLARTAARDEALVVADAALASGLCRDRLREVIAMEDGWPGITSARWVIRYADPYAETALESLGRLTFIEHDLPIPISNAWIDLESHRYRPDHLLDRQWMLFEGDGSQKYDNRLDAGRVITAQREREWRLRENGFEIGRYGWYDARYARPQLADRFRIMIAHRPHREPYLWYRDSQTYRRSA